VAKSKAGSTIFTVLGVGAIVLVGYYVGLPLLKKLTANTAAGAKPQQPQPQPTGAKPGSGGGASGGGANGSGVRTPNGGSSDWFTVITSDIADQINTLSDHSFGQQQDFINNYIAAPDFTGSYGDPFVGGDGTQAGAIDTILGGYTPAIPDFAPDTGGGYDWGGGFGDFGAGSFSDFGG
jgi:hypothetical protein